MDIVVSTQQLNPQLRTLVTIPMPILTELYLAYLPQGAEGRMQGHIETPDLKILDPMKYLNLHMRVLGPLPDTQCFHKKANGNFPTQVLPL